MKVCDLTQFYSPVSGGVKRYVREKIRFMEARGAGSHLLIIPGERDERMTEGASTVCTIRSPLLSRRSGYRALVRLSAINEILAAERPDIIECGDPYQVAWRSISAGRRLGIPVVGFYHSHFSEAYLRYATERLGAWLTRPALSGAQRYTRALYNRFSRTLVPSPALAALLAQWGVANTESIDLGIDTALFRPFPPGDALLAQQEREETRRSAGIPPLPPETTLLLYIGRLAQEKNTRTLFAAFEQLHQRACPPAGGRRFHLLVVGDGLQRTQLKTLEQSTGSVTWLPYCNDAGRLARLYRAADLFVHPGVQETFGLVTLESQACGTPVVGIRGSYMDRIIHTSQEHWAEENTPQALARAIDTSAQMLCEGSILTGATAASALVHARYDWNRVFERLFEVYQSAIDAYKGSDA